MSEKKELKEYIVSADFNTVASPEAARKAAAGKLEYMETVKIGLDAIRQPVVDTVVREGGRVIDDASGVGVKDHPSEYNSSIVFEGTEDLAEKVRKVPGVLIVSDNGDCHTNRDNCWDPRKWKP